MNSICQTVYSQNIFKQYLNNFSNENNSPETSNAWSVTKYNEVQRTPGSLVESFFHSLTQSLTTSP